MTNKEALEFLVEKFSAKGEVGYAGAPAVTQDWRAIHIAESAGYIQMVRHNNVDIFSPSPREHEWLARDEKKDRRVYKLTKKGIDEIHAMAMEIATS